jgi:hypothetical protein
MSEVKNIKTGNCELCDSYANLCWVYFKSNVSYFVERTESTYKGNFCKKCIRKIFFKSTGKTLYGTWWGVVGAILGPGLIINNIAEIIKANIALRKAKKQNY